MNSIFNKKYKKITTRKSKKKRKYVRKKNNNILSESILEDSPPDYDPTKRPLEQKGGTDLDIPELSIKVNEYDIMKSILSPFALQNLQESLNSDYVNENIKSMISSLQTILENGKVNSDIQANNEYKSEIVDIYASKITTSSPETITKNDEELLNKVSELIKTKTISIPETTYNVEKWNDNDKAFKTNVYDVLVANFKKIFLDIKKQYYLAKVQSFRFSVYTKVVKIYQFEKQDFSQASILVKDALSKQKLVIDFIELYKQKLDAIDKVLSYRKDQNVFQDTLNDDLGNKQSQIAYEKQKLISELNNADIDVNKIGNLAVKIKTTTNEYKKTETLKNAMEIEQEKSKISKLFDFKNPFSDIFSINKIKNEISNITNVLKQKVLEKQLVDINNSATSSLYDLVNSNPNLTEVTKIKLNETIPILIMNQNIIKELLMKIGNFKGVLFDFKPYQRYLSDIITILKEQLNIQYPNVHSFDQLDNISSTILFANLQTNMQDTITIISKFYDIQILREQNSQSKKYEIYSMIQSYYNLFQKQFSEKTSSMEQADYYSFLIALGWKKSTYQALNLNLFAVSKISEKLDVKTLASKISTLEDEYIGNNFLGIRELAFWNFIKDSLILSVIENLQNIVQWIMTCKNALVARGSRPNWNNLALQCTKEGQKLQQTVLKDFNKFSTNEEIIVYKKQIDQISTSFSNQVQVYESYETKLQHLKGVIHINKNTTIYVQLSQLICSLSPIFLAHTFSTTINSSVPIVGLYSLSIFCSHYCNRYSFLQAPSNYDFIINDISWKDPRQVYSPILSIYSLMSSNIKVNLLDSSIAMIFVALEQYSHAFANFCWESKEKLKEIKISNLKLLILDASFWNINFNVNVLPSNPAKFNGEIDGDNQRPKASYQMGDFEYNEWIKELTIFELFVYIHDLMNNLCNYLVLNASFNMNPILYDEYRQLSTFVSSAQDWIENKDDHVRLLQKINQIIKILPYQYHTGKNTLYEISAEQTYEDAQNVDTTFLKWFVDSDKINFNFHDYYIAKTETKWYQFFDQTKLGFKTDKSQRLKYIKKKHFVSELASIAKTVLSQGVNLDYPQVLKFVNYDYLTLRNQMKIAKFDNAFLKEFVDNAGKIGNLMISGYSQFKMDSFAKPWMNDVFMSNLNGFYSLNKEKLYTYYSGDGDTFIDRMNVRDQLDNAIIFNLYFIKKNTSALIEGKIDSPSKGDANQLNKDITDNGNTNLSNHLVNNVNTINKVVIDFQSLDEMMVQKKTQGKGGALGILSKIASAPGIAILENLKYAGYAASWLGVLGVIGFAPATLTLDYFKNKFLATAEGYISNFKDEIYGVIPRSDEERKTAENKLINEVVGGEAEKLIPNGSNMINEGQRLNPEQINLDAPKMGYNAPKNQEDLDNIVTGKPATGFLLNKSYDDNPNGIGGGGGDWAPGYLEQAYDSVKGGITGGGWGDAIKKGIYALGTAGAASYLTAGGPAGVGTAVGLSALQLFSNYFTGSDNPVLTNMAMNNVVAQTNQRTMRNQIYQPVIESRQTAPSMYGQNPSQYIPVNVNQRAAPTNSFARGNNYIPVGGYGTRSPYI